MADTSKRGFASMDPARQREIASKGGRAAHQKGTAHEFTSEEARQAGRKGGESVSRNRAHMAAIGRKGGESRSANRSRDEMRTPAFGSAATERGNGGDRSLQREPLSGTRSGVGSEIGSSRISDNDRSS